VKQSEEYAQPLRRGSGGIVDRVLKETVSRKITVLVARSVRFTHARYELPVVIMMICSISWGVTKSTSLSRTPQALEISQENMLAVMLPSVIIGNFGEISCAGLLDCYERTPWKGEAISSSYIKRLVGAADRTSAALPINDKLRRDAPAPGAAVAIVIALYISGSVAMRVLGLPAPLTVLTLSAIFQLTNGVSARLRTGVFTTFTYPDCRWGWWLNFRRTSGTSA
jgi:Na+/citrate or Na+/malate symporter